MGRRERLISVMARAAHDHHFCSTGANGNLCAMCKGDGRDSCFELSGGYDHVIGDDWDAAARGALEALERELGIKVG